MEPRASRLALVFIFITMLVDTIGLGIIIPVSPQLIASLTHEGMSGAARALRLDGRLVPIGPRRTRSSRAHVAPSFCLGAG